MSSTKSAQAALLLHVVGPLLVRAPLVIRGKHLSEDDLQVIARCVEEHSHQGRSRISLVICQKLNWMQPNGWPQDRASRDILLHLEAMGVIALPPRGSGQKLSGATRAKCPKAETSHYDLGTELRELPSPIILEFAKGNQAESTWNVVVNQHHYLGHRVIVGRCIKYLVRSGDHLIGAVAFSSPAWRLGPRDGLLGLLGMDLSTIRDRVINNSRFLILPNVRAKNVASKVLSMATERVVRDWRDYYRIQPQVAETFVEPSRFLGTCYKAANWIDIGVTQGYAKKGSSYHNSQTPKRIFLYGLSRRMRGQLFRLSLLNSPDLERGANT